MKNFVKSLVIIALFVVIPLGVDAQTQLRDGRATNGTIPKKGGTISFRYAPASDGMVAIETTGSIDTYLEVYNDQNQKIAEDDNSGQNNNARIYTEVERNKTYRIDVKGVSANDTGRFSISATSSAEPKTAEEYRLRGGFYLDKKEYSRALTDFNRAIELDPKLARAYHNRGQVYYMMAQKVDEIPRAIREFERALEIDPNFIRAAYANAYISDCYRRMRNNENAIIYANKALEIDKNNDLALKVISTIVESEAKAKAKIDLQNEINTQMGLSTAIDKSLYEIIGEEGIMGLLFGMSPFRTGRKYVMPVPMGINTPYGATFAIPGIAGFADPEKRLPEKAFEYKDGFYIYFTYSRRSGNDIFINLEYIELID